MLLISVLGTMTSKTPTCLPPCGPFGPSRNPPTWIGSLDSGAFLESSQQEQQSPSAGWSARQEPGESRVVGSTGLEGADFPGWVLNLESQRLCLHPPLSRQPPSETIVGTIGKPPLLPATPAPPTRLSTSAPGPPEASPSPAQNSDSRACKKRTRIPGLSMCCRGSLQRALQPTCLTT